MKTARFLLSIVAGTVVLVLALLLLCVGITIVVPVRALSGWRLGNPLRRVGSIAVWLIDQICLRFFMGMKSVVVGLDAVTPKVGNEIYIIAGNHPPFAGLFPSQAVATMKIGQAMAVVKSEFLTDWRLAWLGWPAYLAGLFIPIDRKDPKRAKETIAKAMERLGSASRPVAIVIFLDSHRPSPDRIKADREKFLSKGLTKFDLIHYTETCIGRYGGLWTIVSSLKWLGYEERLRLILSVYGFSKANWSLDDTRELVGETTYQVFEDCTYQMRKWQSEDDCKDWIYYRWPSVNGSLRGWRGAPEPNPRDPWNEYKGWEVRDG